jgi:hypothetical protein
MNFQQLQSFSTIVFILKVIHKFLVNYKNYLKDIYSKVEFIYNKY